MSPSLIRVVPPVTPGTIGAAPEGEVRHRFVDQGAPKTASYSMSSWDSAHYDATSGSIVQPLPASPAVGDECELYLDATSGTNTLSATFNSVTVATLQVAGHMTTVRYNGTTWKEGPDKKSLSSQDGRYSMANPALTVTYNSDGTVASTVENGMTTTFTYNGNGTVHTETRNGIARTFSYNSDGTVGGAA
jgi:YD repeat-containing protein